MDNNVFSNSEHQEFPIWGTLSINMMGNIYYVPRKFGSSVYIYQVWEVKFAFILSDVSII